MPINRTVQIIFLFAAIIFELILTAASTFYVPWNSFTFLLVVLSAVVSISAIIYYVLMFDERIDPETSNPWSKMGKNMSAS